MTELEKLFDGVKIYRGEYDDYGGILGLENMDYDEQSMSWIFHEWAFETIVGKDWVAFENEKTQTWILDFMHDLYFFRKNPMGCYLLGQQHKDMEEMKMQLRLVKAMENYLIGKIDEYEKWNDE